jgi:hypothetical protein
MAEIGQRPLPTRIDEQELPSIRCERCKALASPTGFEPRVYAMSVASSWATRRRGLAKSPAQYKALLHRLLRQ